MAHAKASPTDAWLSREKEGNAVFETEAQEGEEERQEVSLPSSIRVAAFDIEIRQWTAHDGDDRGCFGEFSARQQSIRVDESLKPQKLLDTTLHELNHAVWWAYNLDDEDKEERVVATYATAWVQIWRDNPEFLKWMNDMVRKANG